MIFYRPTTMIECRWAMRMKMWTSRLRSLTRHQSVNIRHYRRSPTLRRIGLPTGTTAHFWTLSALLALRAYYAELGLCICRVSVPLQQQKSSFDAMWAVPCLHTRDAAEHRLDYLIMHALSGTLYRFTKCGFSSLGFLRCSV